MQYLGGKARIARQLSEVMIGQAHGRDIYLEPFLGGANVFCRMAPNFPIAIGSDASPDLMAMWMAATSGWQPPTTVSQEEYQSLRYAEPSALRGFVGFACSFGGKWFGGYAKNRRGDDFAGAGVRALAKQVPALRDTHLYCVDYQTWTPDYRYLVYCDPPYAGMTAYTATGAWNADAFWTTMDAWSNNGALVFVSEYQAPVDWKCVWERDVKVSLTSGSNDRVAVERLWVKDN